MYDVSGGTGDRNCVVLNDIHIDIMDYIVPASCTDSEFRRMWAEFEWENKVKAPLSSRVVFSRPTCDGTSVFYSAEGDQNFDIAHARCLYSFLKPSGSRHGWLKCQMDRVD